MASLLIKVSLGDDTRRITVSTTDFTFDSLLSLLGSRYAVDASALTLKYIDDENEMITIADDADLTEALSVAAAPGKLVIKVSEKPAKAKSSTVEEALEELSKALGVNIPHEMLDHAIPFLRKFAQGGKCGGWGGCRPRCRPCPSETADGKALHWGITCDISGQHPIKGTRYHKRGEDYDLCEEEFNKLSDEAKAAFEAIEKPRHRCQQRSEPVAEGELLPAAPLSRGARGPGVAQLQSILIQMGAMNPGGVRRCMGMFGPYTAQGVASVQKELGVEVTGEFDEAVRAHLLSKLGAAEPAPQEPAAEPELPEPQELPPVPKLELQIPVAPPAPPSEEELAREAERVARDAEKRQRAGLLVSMGFSEAEVEGALTATQGSLERAADWLFVARREAEEAEAEAIAAAEAAFPEEWKDALADLMDMGFEEEPAKDALKACDGNLKAAIKTLVKEERNTPRKN